MPTYAYACTACDHRFEVQQAFSDAALTQCPECEGRLRKLFNSVGIVFKGSGFYRTDSRDSGAKGSSGSLKNGDGGSSSSSDSTSSSSSSDSPSTSSTGSGSSSTGSTSSSDSGSSSGSGTSSSPAKTPSSTPAA